MYNLLVVSGSGVDFSMVPDFHEKNPDRPGLLHFLFRKISVFFHFAQEQEPCRKRSAGLV
jgi:hypothetical protein